MTQDFTTPKSPNGEPSGGTRLQTLNRLNAWGTVSYVLHLIVAVGALIPGGQFGPVLLIIALVIDLVKRGDAEGTWHASHFRWRIRTVIIAALLYLVTAPLWLLLVSARLDCLAGHFRLVPVPHRAGLVRMNKGLPMEIPA